MFDFLTVTLGAAIKSLATKAVTGPVEGMARKALKAVDGRPLDQATVAVGKAVEAARRDLVNDYWAGEDALSRDVVTLLRHPPFAEAVVRRLLFRGQPDFDRLRRAYLDLEDKGDLTAAGERWQALQGPLAIFFEVVEQHLEADPHLGPLLRDSRRLAALGRLEADQRLIAEASREIQRYQQLAARAAEAGSGHLADLVTIAGDGNATLGRILELLSEQSSRLSAGTPPADFGQHLLAAEEHYLRLLRLECNRLPLADDSRDVSADRADRAERPELANVYIDLETTAAPRAERIFDRLAVPESERQALLERLGAGGEGASRKILPAAGLAAGLSPGELLRLPDGEPVEDHPLGPWAADKETLAAACRPLSALEALEEQPYLVLLGDPGSGKSTLVNHLAVSLACCLLGEDDGARPRLSSAKPSGSPADSWFPVRLVLRRWSAGLRAEEVEAGNELELLYQALADLPGDVPRERWLERFDDAHTLVLFDGLDEVPAGGEEEIDRRRVIIAAVEAFRAAHPACRVLVTCRVKPYHEGPSRLAGCPIFQLAALDDDRIQCFCERWYAELARVGRLLGAEARERRERLAVALGERPVLREMAGTPLLLTMLARVNARARLPESRAELYGECVEQLLWEWERRKRGGTGSLVRLLEQARTAPGGSALGRADFERVLWRLTWEAHGDSGKQGTVDLPFAALRAALARVHPQRDPGWAWANRVLELMRERGGLLIEARPGVFTFPHRSFQEYLACRWLLEQDDAPSTSGSLAGDDAWGEVILLSCGYLAARGRFGDLQAIVAELVAGDQPAEPGEWRRVLLAGRAWLEFGPHRAQGRLGEDLATKVPRLLSRLMQHPDLPPPQRLEAGLLAADAGALPSDLDAWVEIPADALEYGFKIGKYPVANAQYQRFVVAGGYDREQGWFSEEAQTEILDWEKRFGQDDWPAGPRYEKNPRFNRATLPVTGVSWYEVAAYATWLTDDLRQAGDIGEDEVVRLATVAEFQRAAGGTEGRKYSWDGDFEPRWANTKEGGLNGPTPVHMYAAGATPEGIFDLTGNVWEWTADKEGSGLDVLAGGAYWNDAEGVGAAARSRLVGYFRNDDIGFRVVVVPVSRADPAS